MSAPSLPLYYEECKQHLYEIQERRCDICGIPIGYSFCALDRRSLNPGYRSDHIANLRLLCPSCQEKRQPSLICETRT